MNEDPFNISTGPQPLGLAIADFDGDEKLDIAVAVYDGGSGNHVELYRNTSSPGSFSFERAVKLKTGSGPEGLAAGDLNGDGKVDLAVANAGSGSLSILYNGSTLGVLRFATAHTIGLGGTPHRVEIADFDQDGIPDVVVSNNSARTISILSSSFADGPMERRLELVTPSYLNQFALADIDGDRRLDLLVPCKDSGVLLVYRNSSQPGAFSTQSAASFLTDSTPEGIAAGDLYRQGRSDIVLANDQTDTVSVFANTSSRGEVLLSREDTIAPGHPNAVVIEDSIENSPVGVAVSNCVGNSISVLKPYTMGGARLLQVGEIRVAECPMALGLADLDGDQKSDLVVTNHLGDSLSIVPHIFSPMLSRLPP